MNDGRYFQRLLCFVALKMTDHMPVDFIGHLGIILILFEEFVDLGGNLFHVLNTVFAKVNAAQPYYLFDAVGGGGLGYYYQLDVFGGSAGSLTCRANLILNAFQPVRYTGFASYHSKSYPCQQENKLLSSSILRSA